MLVRPRIDQQAPGHSKKFPWYYRAIKMRRHEKPIKALFYSTLVVVIILGLFLILQCWRWSRPEPSPLRASPSAVPPPEPEPVAQAEIVPYPNR